MLVTAVTALLISGYRLDTIKIIKSAIFRTFTEGQGSSTVLQSKVAMTRGKTYGARPTFRHL